MKVPSIRAAPDRPAAELPPEAVAPPVSASPPLARAPIGYFGRLWRADFPLSRVFWQDMILVGTLVNLAAMGLAVLAVVLGASTATGIVIFLAPVPYSILLVASVWRRAGVERSDWGWPARIGALVWLILAFVV